MDLVYVDPGEITGGDPFTIRSSFGPGEDITDANYSIQFPANAGQVVISSATNSDGETGFGAGVINLVPTVGNCITTDVRQFQATGAFVIATS